MSYAGAILKVPVIVLLSCKKIKKSNLKLHPHGNYSSTIHVSFSPIKARY